MKNYKVILINLKKDIERLVFMDKKLKELGLEYERLDAVNGREYIENKLGDEYDEILTIKQRGVKLFPGEIGCSLSHKRSWENFINSEKEYALIMEDDIKILSKDFKKIIEEEIEKNNKNKKWDYLQIDYWSPKEFWGRIWFNNVKLTYKSKTKINEKLFFIIKTILKIALVIIFALTEIIRDKFYKGDVNFYRDIYLAGAYIINKKAAGELLKLSKKIIYPADEIQNIAKKRNLIKVKYYCPCTTRQQREIFESNLAKDYINIK